MRISAIVTGLALAVLSAAPALAQSKFTKLENEPAIRNKIEYRDGRFEIVPTGITSLASGLRQHFQGGLRLRYHFSDVFAIGLGAFGGISLPTGTFNDIISERGLEGGDDGIANSADSAFDDLRRVREIKAGVAVDGEFTPIYGKISIAGRFFARYDISAIAGVSAIQTADIVAPIGGAITTRTIPSPHLGLGTRIFFSEMVALNLDVRDTILIDNLDGGINAAGEPVNELNHFLTLGLGASVFFPGKAKIGR